ncbi:MAG: NAD(P)/FAD-dependent oxidoreductase [Chloroflexota bacterium]
MSDIKSDVIVIGGGLAGLTTAVYLAQAGKKVTLVEKARRLGGRASSTEKEGFVFNQGPHAIYVQGAGHAILKELGVPFNGKKPMTVKKSWGALNGRLHLLPGDALSFFQTELLNKGGRFAIMKFFLALMQAKPELLTDQTAQTWLDAQITHPNLRKIMEMLGRVATYTNQPEQVSANMWVQQLQFALQKNVVYIDGGWQTLVAGLRSAAKTAGVQFVTSERATAVTESATHATVTLAGGDSWTTHRVVMTTDPKNVAELLPNHPLAQKWAETAVPVRAAMFDVGLKTLPNPNRLLAFDLEKPYYLSTHSNFAKLAPENSHLIHVMKYLAPDEPGQGVRDELKAFLSFVQPGWQDHLIYSRALPEMTVTHWLPTVENGGINGRPPIQIPGRQRLFLAGDWVGSEGWLADASFASGRAVANRILAQRQLFVDHKTYSV